MLSIIMPCLNLHEYTQECIQNIVETTKNFEIILIDNGSNPPYLSEDVKVIRNDINLGFPAAINQGLVVATGDIICVLNNDIITTPDWAEHLIWHLNNGLDVVGPRTNYIDGPQILLISVYLNKEELYERAKEHYKKNKHKQWAFPRLVGFCLMFKREVYEKIGGFDEIFGIGNFEDDDWNLKAIEADYKTGIARDCYLHHFGSKTHELLSLDYNELLNKNRKIFQSRWSDKKIEELTIKNKEAIKWHKKKK